MRLGIDGRKIPESALRGPIGSLEHGHALGLSGLFFRTVLDMSPQLDPGQLRDIRATADGLGMYLETGLGKVNPFAVPETPELRAAGDGDIMLGFRRMMEACAAIGCVELWAGTANIKPMFQGRFTYDRFRTDVDWEQQLEATSRFLLKLAPIARNLGIHINLETHEEITSFELLRLIETVGDDVIGITFDTGNVLQRGEHPVFAARRIAPYVRQTHIKDAFLGIRDGAIDYQMRACGDGCVAFGEILPILAAARPSLNLSMENADYQSGITRKRFSTRVELFDPEWLLGHPDLSVEEFAAYMLMVETYQARVVRDAIPDAGAYAQQPWGFDDAIAFIQKSASYLRGLCQELHLQLDA